MKKYLLQEMETLTLKVLGRVQEIHTAAQKQKADHYEERFYLFIIE